MWMLDAQNTFSPLSHRSVRCWPVQIFTFWALSQQWAAVTIVFLVQNHLLFSHNFLSWTFYEFFNGFNHKFSWTFLITQNDTTTCPAVIDHKMDDPWPWIWECLNSTYNSVITILSGELWRTVGCSAFQSFWYSLFCSWPCCKCRCFLGCCDLLGCCIGGIKVSTMPFWKILRIIQIISVTSFSPMTFIIILSYIASENKIRIPVPVPWDSQFFTCTWR